MPRAADGHHLRCRIGDSGKHRRLEARIGKKAGHGSGADACRGLGDGSHHRFGTADVGPGRVDIGRPSDGGRVAEQGRRSSHGESFPRPGRDLRGGFGSSKHSNCRHRGPPGAEHLGTRRRLGVGMEVGVHCGARNVMRSLFTACCEDRLSIVSGRTYQRTHDLGRDLVVNFDGVRTVFLPDEMECNGRSARFDVTSPERCKSVRMVISGIPVVSDPQQASLQEPDHCGRHDTRGQWIPPVVSDVARHLMVERGNARGEERHALELAVTGEIDSGGRVSVLGPTALVDPRGLHGRTGIGGRPHVDPCGRNGQPPQSFEYRRVIHRRASLVDPPVGSCCYPVKAGRPEGPGHSTQSEILFPHWWTHSSWLTRRGTAGHGTPWSLGTRTSESDLGVADDGSAPHPPE